MSDNVKICFKCGRTKPVEMFYKHPQMADGRLGKCKECAKEDVAKNYALRRKQYSDYERKRNQYPKRRASKRRYRDNRRKNHPEKYRATMAVSNAVRDGRLMKKPCIHCGNPKVQAHHDDYSKPLDVKWVCFKCHREKEHGQTVSV